MGNRGNIRLIYENKKEIYFYTHWEGSRLESIIAEALNRKERWHDPPYLARIIFCTLVLNNLDGSTGYGIDTGECDPENPTVTINLWKQTVDSLSYSDYISRYNSQKIEMETRTPQFTEGYQQGWDAHKRAVKDTLQTMKESKIK